CSNRRESVDGSSLWIAIDGWAATYVAHVKGRDGKWNTYRSSDILQAGTESDVHCYHGGPLSRYQTKAYFWIEWGGYRDIAVEPHHHRDLSLPAGDTIDLRIDVATSGANAWKQATLNLTDETTGFVLPPRTFRSGCVDCGTPYSRPAKLFGNTAEWITEATFYDYGHARLPNSLNDFGKVRMTKVVVKDQFGNAYSPADANGAKLNMDWMTWNGKPLVDGGTLLACSSSVAARAVTFARAPYVIATPGQQGKLEPKPQQCT
ncbi:MAG TPA: G1 family glutamic endopeptidase, partial [Candidatus Tumulicola sp.]